MVLGIVRSLIRVLYHVHGRGCGRVNIRVRVLIRVHGLALVCGLALVHIRGRGCKYSGREECNMDKFYQWLSFKLPINQARSQWKIANAVMYH